MHSLLLFTTLLLLSSLHAQRPDTGPDTELRPNHLFEFDEDDDTTLAPITDPFQLPRMPFWPNPKPDDYVEAMDHDEEPVHVDTIYYVTNPESSSTVVFTTDDADELDGQQERLENSSTKNFISWRLVLAGTCLLCIISTFMLS